VLGTTFVQTGSVQLGAVWVAMGIGSLACAILVANNLRDIPTDTSVGKRTLAVILGDRGTRVLLGSLHVAAMGCAVLAASALTWEALLALAALPLSGWAVAAVARGATGSALIPVLRDTGLAELVYAVGLATGLVLAVV
jgi:1,4-dihydroxy-2-naphthoate octaprenyltransferase